MQNPHSPFENPLQEPLQTFKRAEPCLLVIFGATGDLTARRLLPALYNLAREKNLPHRFACIGFARRDKSHEEFREEMLEAVREHSRIKPIDQSLWKQFSKCLFYHRSEFGNDEGYDSLKKFADSLDQEFGTKGNRVYYLSTPPSDFPRIVEKLGRHGLIYPAEEEKERFSRVIVEKPFGHDLESANHLQNEVEKHLSERQIYRIDHWLGKETVQNLLVFRFNNSIFEDLWNSRHIDHVQITVAEDLGIGTRGNFFEEAGMLRDIVQNHMMQLLCLVAMEPPVRLDADSIHAEKVKVLKSIRPIPMDAFDDFVVRGQYGRGFIQDQEVAAYREENNVAPDSSVETFAALQLFIDNWRWSSIPFFLRAGKRLPKKTTEIAIAFRQRGSLLYSSEHRLAESNVLVIRIQPNEGISLLMNCKIPGLTTTVQAVKMDFSYGLFFGLTPPEAYERLICDCMAGDRTLFAQGDEVLISWELMTPILNRWRESPPSNFPNYASGTWGPAESDELLKKSGRQWRLL